MKTRPLCILLIFMLVAGALMPVAAAMTSSEAKAAWYDAKEASLDAQAAHRAAKAAYAADPSPANCQAVIDTGKDALYAALDEVEAWLVWKDAETAGNPEISDSLKAEIHSDVERNLDVIDGLRTDVDGVDTQLELGLVWLKCVGKYLELCTDVMRNVGLAWCEAGDAYAGRAAEYEGQLRSAAVSTGNTAAIAKLDLAAAEIESARENIDRAETEYRQVVVGATPLISFANGNNYLQIAQGELIAAVGYENQAYALLMTGGGV